MYKTALLLPPYLANEVIDMEQKYDETRKYNEESQFNDFIEYSQHFLYTPQVLRIYPDDYHQVLRTLINSSALMKSSATSRDQETSMATTEEQNTS
jgi:hypothetical protein